MSLSTIGMLFGSSASSGGINYASLASGSSSGAAATASAGSIKAALANAEKNEAKQREQVAKDPQIVKDLARYEKVVKNAKTIDDVFKDPVARAVLMTANGLKADIDNIALAKRAMTSDPKDAGSVAAKMASINGNWLTFAKSYNLAEFGLDALSPRQDGAAGRWRLALEREGESIEALLEIKKARGGGYQATVDGVPVPVNIDGSSIRLDLIWRDTAGELRTSTLNGTLGKTGFSGTGTNDGETTSTAWSAPAYFANSVKTVSENYIAEKRLDLLDQQLPGLGSAVLFKQVASSLEDSIDVLGSSLGREVITTAFGIPKQIAVQSIEAQKKAIDQRVDFSKLQKPSYVDIIAQRYLLVLNGGLGGVTA